MNLTKADVAMLGRRRVQPIKRPSDLVAVFVAGKLVNLKNARLHWAQGSKYKRGWRDATALALLEAGWRSSRKLAAAPKRVLLLAFTARAMDDDGLASALQAVRDGLIDGRVVHGDAPADGHEFVYTQVADPARTGVRGVEVRVMLRAPASEPRSGEATPA